jgi:CMP-N-acetylneuraminic acid synthetase
MRILTIIPARSGSKGVPGKNIKLLGGKPLIDYTIEFAKNSGLDKIIVSTDTEEIAAVARNSGAEVPFLRPENLADDKTPTIDVLIHLIEALNLTKADFDAVCLLQPTVPFRTNTLLQNCIDKYIQNNLDSLVTVKQVPSHFNPHWTFETTKDQLLKISTGEDKLITRRQDLPTAFYRDGSIYLTSMETLLNDKSLYGERLGFFENIEENYVNIDTMQDWYKAEELLKKNVNQLY